VIVAPEANVIVPEFAVVVAETPVPPELKEPFSTILSAALNVTVPSVDATVTPVLIVSTPAAVADVNDTFTLPVIFAPTVM
jgi:hypothetical protein